MKVLTNKLITSNFGNFYGFGWSSGLHKTENTWAEKRVPLWPCTLTSRGSYTGLCWDRTGDLVLVVMIRHLVLYVLS